MLNEFALMYALKDQFPLHYIVSKQVPEHTSHTRPTVSRRSRARVTTNLSDPNMRPHYLALLSRVSINKDMFEPSVEAIKARYYTQSSARAGRCPRRRRRNSRSHCLQMLQRLLLRRLLLLLPRHGATALATVGLATRLRAPLARSPPGLGLET